MEIVIILILIVFNGLLSMAEIAIIAAKKTKLRHLADKGDKNAEKVLKLADNPNKLFSTIQVGITLIGTLTGAIGAVAFTQPFTAFFEEVGFTEGVSHTIAVAIVVFLITYVSIIIGELVPKRLGLNNPETISRWMVRSMDILAKIFGPLVDILSITTDAILQAFNIQPKQEIPMSLDEVRVLLQQGSQSGIIKTTEKDIVEKTLNLSDKKVTSIMTASNKIIWIDIDSDIESLKKAVLQNQFSYYPVCKKDLDDVKGIINSDSLLAAFIANQKISIKDLMYKPLLIPENLKALQVMELFKRNHIHMGIVIDEYGNVQGLVTVTDILEAIVGDLPEINDREEKKIIRRNQNSWLVDGLLSTAEFKEHFKIDHLPGEKEADYNTIGGFAMHILGRVPISSDHFEIFGYRFEVVDMDGNRVDKIMIVRSGGANK